jgi:hypothetical protein
MSEKPEALRLADAMTRALEQTDAEDDVIQVARWFVEDSRAELRRLHALNGELLEALKRISATKNLARELEAEWCPAAAGMVRMACAAIAKAEGNP